MSSPFPDQHSAGPDAGSFSSIACGIDGTRASFEAVRQAALLADDAATVRLLAVTWETGTRASSMVALSRRRATTVLERAHAIAHEFCARTDDAVIDGPDAVVKLLELASRDDLLVVGSSGRSHTGGLMLGHPAGELLRSARVSLLVARRPPSVSRFPDSILIAAAEPIAFRRAAETAAALARSHGADVVVISGPAAEPAARHTVADAITSIAEATGVEPVVIDGHGKLHATAVHVAADLGASLIVTAGASAERIAERARCSVLVVRAAG